MKAYFIHEENFESFLGKMLLSTKVIGPVAKKNKFVYQQLTSPNELRLDFDVTLLPPKKAFFPPRQELLSFRHKALTSSLAPTKQVLFGVHFYDIKAIDMLDLLFKRGHPDMNYLANREASTIVGSNICRISPRAFWSSVGKGLSPKGHDAFLTRVNGGFVYESFSYKGDKLLSYGHFDEATDAQIHESREVNERVLDSCPESLGYDKKELAEKVRKSFDRRALWEELSHDCFSCGSCNLVCPTCYCFDVQDNWHIDQVSGVRYRVWDGCLLEDFSEVSLGGGLTENFREERADRFRHRIMRKAAYLSDILGSPACVGCGRCSINCVPDIADPTRIVDRIMEVTESVTIDSAVIDNTFLPREAEIVVAKQITELERRFTVRMKDGSRMDFTPGQILEVSVHGYGEIPIGFASSPTRTNTFDLVVRTVGRVSRAINRLEKGDSVFVRGPLGNGFDLEKLRGHPVLIVAGGIGLCPTRSLIQYILDRRQEFGTFNLFFGAKSPKEQLFLEDLAQWRSSEDVNYYETVDRPDSDWKGNVGVITTLFQNANISPDTRVVICGPPVMYRFVIKELDRINVNHRNIYVDLERRMKCGIGKCGHCQINDKYVCIDGPVFCYDDIKHLEEAFQ